MYGASIVEQFACRSSKLEHLYAQINNEQTVEECDATGDAMKTIVGFTKIIAQGFLLLQLLNVVCAR